MMVPACCFISLKMVMLSGFLSYIIHGRRREMGLAALRDVSLKQACELAPQWRSCFT